MKLLVQLQWQLSESSIETKPKLSDNILQEIAMCNY